MTSIRHLLERVLSTPWRRLAASLALLALAGVAVRHAWWTGVPLSAGDWPWWGPGRLQQWSPWPTIWDPTLGFAGQNRFEDAFRYPVYALVGLIHVLGGGWSVAEKVVYFGPFAILLPIAGFLFAREVMGRTRWTWLAPVILVGSTYLILEGNVHVPLTISEVLGVLALTTFLRTVRRRRVPWAVATGLLLSLATAFDVRPAYLTALLMALYVVMSAPAKQERSLLLRRLMLLGLAAAVFALTQAYWWLPLLAYGSSPHFPTPLAPDFNILTLEHGIAGQSTFWTGGAEAFLAQAQLNPAFMILPLLALIPLLRRRITIEVLWLSVAAVIAAFMAKTNNPPLGGLYDWFYLHVPGGRLFREGSKFLYIVVIAYAVLVPMALQALVEWASQRARTGRVVLRGIAIAGVAGVLALTGHTVVVLESGILDSTTQPTHEPTSFAQLASVLAADQRPGAVMWFGDPILQGGGADRNHRFVPATAAHSIAYMTGTLVENQIHHRDNFQFFCADPSQPYCYLDDAMFPYLAQLNGAAYAVTPGGSDIGVLPNGITRTWLRQRITAMYGSPRMLGTGAQSLLVWRLPSVGAVVRSANAIASVDSGPWSLRQVLPALQALGVPAVYTQSLDAADFPIPARTLDDSVEVMPRLDGSCTSIRAGPVAVMAMSSDATLAASLGGAPAMLPLLQAAAGAPGWSFYGPVGMGAAAVSVTAGAVALGPCMRWNSLTEATLSSQARTIATATVASHGERIVAAVGGPLQQWTELARGYDPGWRLGGVRPAAVGDGLLDLYETGTPTALAKAVHNGNLVFQFSTLTAERIGEAVAGVAVLACIGILTLPWVRRSRRSIDEAVDDPPVVFESGFAPYLAAAGIVVLAAAAATSAIGWFGLPSRYPQVALAADPYRLDIGYAAAAIVLVLLASAVRCVAATRTPTPPQPAPIARAPRSLVAASLALVVTLAAASCGITPTDASRALQRAGTEGVSAGLIDATSLSAARVQLQAQNATACIEDYTRALSGFPGFSSALVGRGDCYLSPPVDAPAGAHDYSRAIALAPAAALPLLRRASADAAKGDTAAAVKDYGRAAALPTTSDVAFLSAVDGLLQLGAIEDAHQALDTGRERFPSSGLVHLAAADYAVATDQDSDALSEYAAALPLLTNDSDRARLYATRCHFFLLRLDYSQALQDCRQSVQLTTVGTGAYDDMSVADLAEGNVTQAILDLTRAIGAFTGNVNPEAQPSGVDGFGLALLFEARARAEAVARQPARAIADFQRALAALPPDTPDFAARIKGELQSTR